MIFFWQKSEIPGLSKKHHFLVLMKIAIFRFKRKCYFAILVEKYDFVVLVGKRDFTVLAEKYEFLIFTEKMIFRLDEKLWYAYFGRKSHILVFEKNVILWF